MLKKGTTLYRGMSIASNLYYGMGYDTLEKGDVFSPDEKAIVSFSKSKRIAFEFADDGNSEYKVVIKIQSTEKNLLDISNISKKDKEEETILHKNMWYNISTIKKSEYGGTKWLLMILK